MRILITGSRDWPDDGSVGAAIWDAISVARVPVSEVTIVQGDCPTGADYYAKQLASIRKKLTLESHPPIDLARNGKRAYYLRNKEMVDLGADVCLAFIKDESKGASMTAKMAEDAGILTWRFTL